MSERSMNQYRKEFLYRKATGERILSDYFEKLLSLFPAQDRSEIISLEETDAELDRFTVASTRLHQETGRISTSELRAELSVMKRRQGEFFVLVDDDWKYCGMLLVRSMEDLNVGIEFGDKILNDIVFVSTDMSFATSFDYFEVAGSYLIDVERWRER